MRIIFSESDKRRMKKFGLSPASVKRDMMEVLNNILDDDIKGGGDSG